MAQKKIWVTWMPSGKGALQPEGTLRDLGTVGLQVSGAPWIDDLERMAWYDLGTELQKPETADLWLIAGTGSDFQSPRNRYGLSLVTAMVRDRRGNGLPIFCFGLDQAPKPESLPSLMRDLKLISTGDPSWAAKVGTAFLKKPQETTSDFRISAVGHPFIGQWFEVGPREGEWQGVMFGVSGEGKIIHHMVGPRGQLPDKSVLEYATEGIRAEVRGLEFTAWSVQNKLGPDDSYFVKVEGRPATLLFGGHPGTDQAEVTVLNLV